MSTPIRPYSIKVPNEQIDNLRKRLEATVLPEQLEGTEAHPEWDFGTPVSVIQRLTEYWKDGFDWRKSEEKMNELPQFWTEVDVDGIGEVGLHFVHKKSTVPNAIPLLFSHGWPGSFVEVTKLLTLLVHNDPSRPSFHVVAPSLPNFGFSSSQPSKKFGLRQYAESIHKLMQKLGYDQYGGDWGYSVTRTLGLLYPASVLASHINLVIASPPSITQPLSAIQNALSTLSERDLDNQARNDWFEKEGWGYNLLQSSKPMTISFLLADSPVGVLAWIYEKLHDWTDSYPWTDDEILTWISIYWFSTAGPAASVRIYPTATRPVPDEKRDKPISTKLLSTTYIDSVKLGIAHFPKEINIVPHSWAETLGPVVQQTDHEKGGHFAAWEEPGAIASDLFKMFGKAGPCFGILGGHRSGYQAEDLRNGR